jgi:hypothetical protein
MGGFGTAILPWRLGALLLVSVAFTGCASFPILAPQPPQASPPVDLTAPVSYVAVAVTISTAYLAQELSRRPEPGRDRLPAGVLRVRLSAGTNTRS